MSYENSIEENMDEAEACINKINSEKLSLSETLAEYNKGIELLRFCDIQLNNTKPQIQILDYSTGKLIDVNPESVTGPINKNV